jgi:hypothetical protein
LCAPAWVAPPARHQGFGDARVLSSAPIAVNDPALADALGEARFSSVTFRLFKLPPGRLETLCEDYGQYAVYKGTIPGAPAAYSLDDHHRLEKARRALRGAGRTLARACVLTWRACGVAGQAVPGVRQHRVHAARDVAGQAL